MSHLSFRLNGKTSIDIDVTRLVVASWTGRDRRHLEQQIAGLQAIGVKTPATIPCFYNLACALLTTDDAIEVVGDASTGEVEAVLLHDETHGLLVGVGSDHTDRHVEREDVAMAKQVCAKPIGRDVWRHADVAGHWDAIIARSWRIDAEGERVLYQEGTLARLLQPAALIESVFASASLPFGTALFCGTQPVIGPMSAASEFEFELHDPVRNESLRHRYTVTHLAHAR